MPKSNKSGGFKAAKNYEPRTPGKGGPKAGSRSPGHRGYKAVDESAPRAKQRWNADDRASRGAAPSGRGTERADRPSYGDRPERSSYSDRGARPSYNDRPARGGYQGDRSERPAYDRNDRPARDGERGGYRGDRPERPSYGDRTERPSYGDRPARGGYERPSRENGFNKSGTGTGRAERPSYDRTERPAYGDRPSRDSESGGYGRREPQRTDRQKWNDARNEERRAERAAERTGRPTGGKPPRTDDRGYNRSARPTADYQPGQRADRTARWEPSQRDGAATSRDRRTGERGRPNNAERPAYIKDRAERPAYTDRAPRTGGYERSERPAYNKDRSERPAYNDRAPRTGGYERSERPAYNKDRSERPAYNDRPARSSDNHESRASRGSDFYPSHGKPAFHGADEDVVLERLEAQATLAVDVEGATFASLGLGGNIVRVLGELGAASPFPIQSATIPEVLNGRDVLGRGRTGSGKTIAFGAPLVERLMENGGGANRKPGRKPRALILAPTRELALQIDRTVQPIARAVGLFTTQIYGGVPQARQVGALQRGVDIIIGTPGRIEDLIEQRRLDLSEVTITVLDEADHMCDLGFLEPVQRILRHTKQGGQKLLFSATLDKGVANLVDEFLVNPSVHEVAGEDQASSTIDHRVLIVESRDKSEIIRQLADRDGKTLIFARTRAYAEMLAEQLEDAGFPATSLHGDLNQSRRTRNLQMLTSGRVNVLVATDVAARGIHVDDIDLVIQADAPDEYKTYLHRAGRTGRAGKKGTVVTLIPRARGRRMNELLDRAEIEAEMVTVVPGDALVGQLAADQAR
ncbi:MAG: DEAD/DEAH box helicase [Herbiconiux sp.]|uniref:DEAD/DEAH box helicase n=1 Tax=Herbiconiux sp. TaxID=1871186 RepID=UPI0012222EF6|nr:DEAD/DEAH box helicase [Herbiconiux sp.]TAJ49129.1 MAG: DEAD/DEAH box helicase [Herbiconiux sp.]